jgi:tetratricopeptide (TPR) repeat protein
VEYFCEWKWAEAEREARRAIEINPNLAQAHSSRSRYLLTMGRTEEMLDETKRAVELDPLSFRIRWDRWIAFYGTGRYDEALEQCRKIEELNPNLDLGYLYCGDVHVQQGNLAEAVQEYRKAVDLTSGENPRAIAHLAYAYAQAGRRNDAETLLANLRGISKQHPVHPYLFALVYVGLGQGDTAIAWLEKAYQVRGRDLLDIRYDPQFAGLRSDPRFIDLIRRIGLPPV